ncbi:unnamed protein product [Rhodiola kirilowii]
MENEMRSHRINQTWELVEKSKSKKLVDCKWLFTLKEGLTESDPPRYKARLVAKGFMQKEGVDYTKIFSPVVKFKTIRVMLACAACFDLEIEQLDVTTTFLHGTLDEVIYMRQPLGLINAEMPEHACLLKKSLYGLKQSPRLWYKRFDSFVLSIGFVRSNYDSCLYFSSLDNDPVYLLLYVDDTLLIRKCMHKINKVKSDLKSEFDMKDSGHARKILGMIIDRDRSKCFLKLHQKPYLQKKIVAKFGCDDCKPEMLEMETIPYSNALGSLMYAMIATRHDLCYVVSLLSRYMSKPGKYHWYALKHVIAYVNSYAELGLCYSNRAAVSELIGYVDADFASDRDRRKSNTSYVFTLSGNCIVWKSRLQPLVAQSTTESEYVAICDACKEAVWLQGTLKETKLIEKNVVIYSDSQSALQLSKNPVYHERTKHIYIKYHYIRSLVETGAVYLLKVDTTDKPSDFDTKIVTNSKFKHCLNLLHLE